MTSENDIARIINNRQWILSDSDYNQIQLYLKTLIKLCRKGVLTSEMEIVEELMQIINAIDIGDRATILNITKDPQDIKERF